VNFKFLTDMKSNLLCFALCGLGLFGLDGCQKLVSISPPVGDLVAAQVFSTDDEATSAAAGMYSSMINANLGFASSGISVLTAMSADELIIFNQNFNALYVQFQDNDLNALNGLVYGNLWSGAYGAIYKANAIIEGITNNSGVHDSVRNELTGEAEFVRAFCNFYLVNLFGDIPLVTTINYQKTGDLTRIPVADVYTTIVNDLKDAQKRLAPDFSVGLGQRIIPNQWAATALLARVYLYTSDWQDAVTQSTALINYSSLFGLVSDPGQVFLANSMEAIWQLQQSNTTAPWFNITPEGSLLIPAKLNSNLNPPFAYLTPALLNAFEPGDTRRAAWVDSTIYQNTEYYFPFKYQAGPSASSANGPYTEYYMVFRLAEQYLIRAESEARLGQTVASTNDLNSIRIRAGLLPYQGSNNNDSLLAAIGHENQVEFFVEWGHRWFDLKRTGEATEILTANKGYPVENNMLLYPIPASELKVDPNLVQNPSY